MRRISFIAYETSHSQFKERNSSADKTLASHQLIYENDFVGSTRNALARQNHCDRRMIEEDSSSRRWHRSHRLQSHVRGKGWQLRWITTRHMVSSKRQSRCRQWITLYMCPLLWFYCITHPKCASNVICLDKLVCWYDCCLQSIYIKIVEFSTKLSSVEW